MKLTDLKKEVSQYQYFEDTNFIDVSIATVLAARLSVGNPLWMILIGASSSGKTQILRPLAIANKDFAHQVDDLTENTFLSGFNPGKNSSSQVSLLQRIGKNGMIIMSDLTGIFSKQRETRANILAQLRMVYDGEMTKHVGTSDKPVSWKGRVAVLAGSTPTMYKHFEEVASLGERFLYYRMKDFDPEKASLLMMKRKSDVIDDVLEPLYGDYIKKIVKKYESKAIPELNEETQNRLITAARICELLRSVGDFDWKGGELERIPIPAMPMRTTGQLKSLAKSIMIMREYDEEKFCDSDIKMIEWCAYSLINDERRRILKVFASVEYSKYLTTAIVGDVCGLPTSAVRKVMQTYAAIGIVDRTGTESGLQWKIKHEDVWNFIRRMENMTKIDEINTRNTNTEEDEEEINFALNQAFEHIG